MNKSIYSGFFIRVFATILDIMVLFIPLSLLEKVFQGNTIVSILAFYIIWWLYNSLLISSSLQATLGKKILSIKVLTLEMQQLSFTQASVRYIYSVISYIFILPLFMIFFSKKRQTLHDYLASTVVINEVGRYDYEKSLQNSGKKPIYFSTLRSGKPKKRGVFEKIIIFILGLAIAIPVVLAIFYASVMYMLSYKRDKAYDYSFRIEYNIKDYNNTKIDFYNSELERYSREFIDADDIYSKFEADVKKDIALECIEYFVKQVDRENYIDVCSSFRKRARNKYANTEEKIQKAKDNETFMSHNFYTFDANLVRHTVENLVRVKKDTNISVCDKQISVNKLYKIYMPIYIKNYESSNIYSPFGNKPQQRELDWYEVLKIKYPAYFKAKEDTRRER